MLLGKVIKQVVQAQGPFEEEIGGRDPELACRIALEAGRHGMEPREFIADTVSRFLGHEGGERWTTIISNIQRSDDPGFAFISTIMHARLDHNCDQHA